MAGTGKSNYASSHKFSQIPSANISRSVFDRSHGTKTAFNMGELIPILADEALPGDTLNMRATVFARMATPFLPIMDNMYLDTFFFAVPMRLLWDNWQKFNGEQTDPGDSTDFLIPTVAPSAGGYVYGSLTDYLGIPLAVPDLVFSAMWHRAYNLIWNEWFRDENLQDSVTNHVDDGPDPFADYVVLKRGKRHDYFSSCLPWPQKGPSVELPLGTAAPVVGTGTLIPTFTLDGAPNELVSSSASTINAEWKTAAGNDDSAEWLVTSLEADLSTATASTINAIRQAFQIQKLYERDARGGTRYTEILRSHFGVVSPDQRLQRPEFLGGGSTNIQVNPAVTTSAGGTGAVAAFITAAGQSGFTKSFTEHCIIIGLVSARADLNYQQGLPRQFSRSTRWDFFWPALQHLGEQAVTNREIFAQGPGAGGDPDSDVFGYQERFAEYRYKQNQITGQLRSTASAPLHAWHLAQDFAALPTLGADFIEEDPPMARIKVISSAVDLVFDSFFQYKCVRPMPTYSVPGLIDHF